MQTVRWVFWVAAAVVAYVYVGYPLLLGVAARLFGRAARKADPHAPLPPVSIVLAARNEGRHLGDRLENLLAVDYPAPREIIVVSDGSTDDTARIVRRFAPRVDLIVQPPRGKAVALNAGAARARHPVLVFADARQRFAPDTLRQLVANFADPNVGAVSGQLILDCEVPAAVTASSVADGVGLYWRYEKWLREREGRVGSTLGVTGAVYAMRRSCWQPLPADTVLDDVLAPMRVVLAGKRVVFDEKALAFDRAAPDASVESRRKVRTLAGNYQLLWLEPRLAVPFVNPVWLQFISHKLGRLLVPYALLAWLISSAVLAGSSVMYTAVFAAQVAVVLLAAYGAFLDARTRSADAVRANAVAARLDDEPASPTRRIVNA